RAVFSGNKVSVLADVERAIRVGEKRAHVGTDALRGAQVVRIMPLGVGKRIDTQRLGLDADQLFKVGLVPVTARGILIRPAPDRINQLLLGAERVTGALLCLFVAVCSYEHGIFDRIAVEILVTEAPSRV